MIKKTYRIELDIRLISKNFESVSLLLKSKTFESMNSYIDTDTDNVLVILVVLPEITSAQKDLATLLLSEYLYSRIDVEKGPAAV